MHTGVYLCLMDFLSYSLLPLCGWVDICEAQTLKDTIFAVDYSQKFFFSVSRKAENFYGDVLEETAHLSLKIFQTFWEKLYS